MKKLGVLALALLLPSCANLNSIYRANVPLSNNRPVIIATDAKQRHLTMVPDGANGWRMCAEAAPDVFTALSTSASADLSLDKTDAEKNAQARAAFAIAEAAGTVERTQTVNLLRESLYRTCERYLGGAISRSTFVVQSGRDWRAMIAILAIEQLTRSAKPPATILIPGSTGAAISGSPELMREYAGASAKRNQAETKVKELTPKAENKCEKADATQKAQCEADKEVAKKSLAEAQAEQAAAQAKVDELLKLAQTMSGQGVTSTTTPSGSSVTSNDKYEPKETDMAKVSDAVKAITLKAFDTDETQLFCLQILTTSADDKSYKLASRDNPAQESVEDLCAAYLAASVKKSTEELRRHQTSEAATKELSRKIEIVSDYLMGGPESPGVRWNALLTELGPNYALYKSRQRVAEDSSLATIQARMPQMGNALDELVRHIQAGGNK